MTLPHPVLRRAAAEVLHGFPSLATQVHAKKKKEETIVSSEKQALFPWHHVFGYVSPWRNV